MLKLLFLFAFCVRFCVRAESHDYTDCIDPGKNPKLVYNQEKEETAKFLHVIDKIYTIPESGFFDDPISCVKVMSVSEDQSGYVIPKDGGVGKKFFEVEIKSEPSKGYNYKISIYTTNQTIY